MTRSDEIAELTKALVKAQAALEDADKDATNPHFKSRYADLASVRASLRKPLSDNGLAYTQLLSTTADGACVTTILMHISGQSISETLCMPVQTWTPQAVGSAFTYGRRYSLMAIVGIAASEDDDDAETAMGRPTKTNGQTAGTTRNPTLDAAEKQQSIKERLVHG